jgi:hypothetical protein
MELSGEAKSREYFAKRPEEIRKGTGDHTLVRCREIPVRGKRHFTHFFLEAVVKVPFSNSLEFFECQIGHPKRPHSRWIPDDRPER